MSAAPAHPGSGAGLSPEQRIFITTLARVALRVARRRAAESPATTLGAAPAPEAPAIAH